MRDSLRRVVSTFRKPEYDFWFVAVLAFAAGVFLISLGA